ncbi:hypothetical protein G6F32_014209 [Rhizopus arrhizus]|nr:hypothetical protein G6F32_014209 [Rhizopus arrhizus]
MKYRRISKKITAQRPLSLVNGNSRTPHEPENRRQPAGPPGTAQRDDPGQQARRQQRFAGAPGRGRRQPAPDRRGCAVPAVCAGGAGHPARGPGACAGRGHRAARHPAAVGAVGLRPQPAAALAERLPRRASAAAAAPAPVRRSR